MALLAGRAVPEASIRQLIGVAGRSLGRRPRRRCRGRVPASHAIGWRIAGTPLKPVVLPALEAWRFRAGGRTADTH